MIKLPIIAYLIASKIVKHLTVTIFHCTIIVWLLKAVKCQKNLLFEHVCLCRRTTPIIFTQHTDNVE